MRLQRHCPHGAPPCQPFGPPRPAATLPPYLGSRPTSPTAGAATNRHAAGSRSETGPPRARAWVSVRRIAPRGSPDAAHTRRTTYSARWPDSALARGVALRSESSRLTGSSIRSRGNVPAAPRSRGYLPLWPARRRSHSHSRLPASCPNCLVVSLTGKQRRFFGAGHFNAGRPRRAPSFQNKGSRTFSNGTWYDACVEVVGKHRAEPRGVNCCPICLTNRDNRCSCRPNPACAGCPWFPLPLRRRS